MNSQELIPTFITDRLILREVRDSDLPSYQKNFADYDVIAPLSRAVPWPYPADGVHDFVENVLRPSLGNGRWYWGIFRKEAPEETIGGVDLWREGRPEHRGFWLGKKYWGNGYMTEAVAPVMDYAFDHLGFETLVFSNALGNEKSRRIKEKTGARLTGVRPMEFVDAKYTQAETWEITKEEWKKFRGGNRPSPVAK